MPYAAKTSVSFHSLSEDKMSTEVSSRVSPDLHPDTFLAQVGVDSETAPFVASATEAFESAYAFLGSIHSYRDAAFSDPELTPEGALLKVDDYAHSKLAAVTQKFDGTAARFSRTIAAFEADLSSSVKAMASERVSGEIRSHIKNAGPDRVKLMEQALAEKDEDVLSAVLGAPPMLSGLTKELHATFLVAFNRLRKPETTKRLDALTAARAQLEAKGGLLLREMERAIGSVPITMVDRAGVTRITGHVNPHEVRKMRDAARSVYKKLA